MTEREPERTWEQGWDGHAAAQRARLGSLSLAEKLAWLEQAQRMLLHLSKGPRGAGARPQPRNEPE